MAIAYVVVDGERFVEQNSLRLQGLNQPREQWTVEVEADHDGIVRVHGKFRPIVGAPSQVDLFDGEMWETPLGGGGRKLCETFVVSIDRFNLESMSGQIECMTPVSASDIERTAFRETVELLGDKAGRHRIGGLSMMGGAWPVELHTDGPRLLCNRRCQFPKPKAYAADRKVCEEEGQYLLAEGFQQGADFLVPKFDDPLRNLSVINRVDQMTGSGGRSYFAIEFKVDGHGLGSLPLLRRDAAPRFKFEAFDDNFIWHFGHCPG